MCVANLNVSLQPCSHRWYTLVRSCSSSSNLANCPEKIKLEGWEQRREHCPWCAAEDSTSTDIHHSTHRLFGSMSRQRSSSISGSSGPGDQRSRTSSVSNGSTSPTRSSSFGSDSGNVDVERGERARMMNRRLETYMLMNPGNLRGKAEEKERTSDDDTVAETTSLARSGSGLGRRWKKSMKISRSIFKP